MSDQQTLGKLPRDAIRLLALPPLAPGIIEGFKALVDLTGTISDAMDELGIVGIVPAFELPPVNRGKRIVGPALTVRNIHHGTQIHKAAIDKTSGQGEPSEQLRERHDASDFDTKTQDKIQPAS